MRRRDALSLLCFALVYVILLELYAKPRKPIGYDRPQLWEFHETYSGFGPWSRN